MCIQTKVQRKKNRYRQRYRGTAIRQNKNQTLSHIIPWLLARGGAGDMGMKRKKLLIGFCSALGLLPTDILAAGTAAPTPHQLPLVQENKATLSGTIHTQSFLYNTEYFNKILEGETLFGFHILPSLSLLFAKRIAIQPGLIWQHHFGQPNPWAGFRPTCSTSYHAPNFKLVLGIFGLQEQPLHFIEPLFDPTRPMVRPFIEGLHFKLAGPRGYVMGWVDWLSLLSRKQNQPERFTVHLTTAYRLPHPEGSSCYTVPFQGGIYHVGGQGIAVKDFSLFCGATGILCSFMQPMRFLKRLDCAGYFLCNTYAKQIDRPFKKGWGQFYCLDWVLPTGGITIRYWYGAGFSSENIGNPLYQSVRIIDHKVVHIEATRSLLFATGYKYWDPLAHLRIQCSLCPYIDLKNRLVEFSCSLDLTYTLRFAWTDIQNTPQTISNPDTSYV